MLNNLKNILDNLALFGGSFNNNNKYYVDNAKPFKDVNGNTRNNLKCSTGTPMMSKSPSLATSYSPGSSSYAYLLLGKGTTPVTEDDYVMDNLISTGISANGNSMVKSVECNVENGTLKKNMVLTYNVKNTGTTDLTITEAGIMDCIDYSSSNCMVLLHREVFDPVTIPVGATRTFTFTFEFVNSMA